MSLPSLSPTMTTGKVTQWNFKVGDKLETGDVLCEIETDKASVGYEVQDEGYLAKIMVEDASKDLNVGDLICVLVEEKESIEAFKNYYENQ